MFELNVATVRDDETGLFEAEIAGMEDQLCTGLCATPDEAIDHAVILFAAVVEDCIVRGVSIKAATGQEPTTTT